jgi:hypothetical protein
MSTSPLPLPPPRKPISLAKLATIFAVVFGISFGLCTVSAIGSANGGRGVGDVLRFFAVAAVVIEAICLLGLLIVGLIAIIRSINSEE